MLVVCQPVPTPRHQYFDGFMVRSVCLAFPREPIVYMADCVSCDCMKQSLQNWPSNLQMQEAGVPTNGARRLYLYGKLLVNLIRCRRATEKLGARAMLYLGFHTETCALHLARLPQVPEYYINHNNFHKARRTLWGRFLLRWIGSRATALIFLEQPQAQTARSDCALPADHVLVIPHPREASDQDLDDDREEKRRGIVLVGALKKEKGIQTLLDAARILKTEKPEVLARLPIRIVGPYFSGPDPQPYSDCVEYTNQSLTDAEIEQVIRSSKFIVLPYEPESYAYILPGTFYRALTCNRPVIVTDLPSLQFLTRTSRPVGFGFSGPRQLVNIITRIADMPDHEYAELCDNVRGFVHQRGLMATAQAVQQVLGETNDAAR